jgi:hypothetical protein
MSARTLLKQLSNALDWKTKRHIIVFESDDWGSIRTSNLTALERLTSSGIDLTSLDADRYSYNDSLETAGDLSSLFDVLSSVKDCNNHPAIFTAVCVVANPDFEAIKNSGFKRYFYEPITDTYKKYPECEGSFSLMRHGLLAGVFVPQFHGREHLNVTTWMKALQDGHEETLKVFSEGMWGYVNSFYNNRRINYQEAFNFYDPDEIGFLEEILNDGLNLFEKLFGYRAKFFVAPNGTLSNKLERSLSLNGIQFISQAKIQYEALEYGKKHRVFHYLGMKNKWNQIYLIRNCFFEPSSWGTDWVNSCLNQIDSAFSWHKPAIIGSHRVNYVGSLNKSNRRNGLMQLYTLLSSIKNKWPDIEFLTSEQLGSLILDEKCK